MGEALIKDALYPLQALSPKARFVFIEYHYFKSHMKDIASAIGGSLSGAYKILNVAERKLEEARA